MGVNYPFIVITLIDFNDSVVHLLCISSLLIISIRLNSVQLSVREPPTL